MRFKCPDQSRAPGRKSQFWLEPEKTFSANFWEVEQAGFRQLPSKGRGVSAGAEEVALALSLSSQTWNYCWPPAPSHPLLLFGSCPRAVPGQPCRGGWAGAGPATLWRPHGAGSGIGTAQSLQTQLLSKLGSMAPWPWGWLLAPQPAFHGGAKILFPAFFFFSSLPFIPNQTNK